MRRPSVIALVAAVLMATGAVHAFGQETTGSIGGRVVDAQGLAVPGATVTAASAQGSRTFVTDGEGRFLAPFLTPGVYEIRVALGGFKPVERGNIDVRLGQRVDLPTITLEVGSVDQVVRVVATSPVVDTRTTAVGANLDTELLTRIPVGRQFSDTLILAPGVSSGGATGSANPSIGGGSGLENQYVVDGVNISNAGFGALGSYSIVFGSLGNGVIYDFIKEVQVKSGGYEAEFGQSTGGVVNVITKSGTNVLHGSLFGYSRPTALEGDFTQVQTPNGTVNVTETQLHDFGATVGGPIWRDRAFFFAAVDPQFETRTLIAPDGFPLRSLGELDRDRNILSYAAKGTWQISNLHRVDASFFGDPANGDPGPQRTSALLRTDTAAFSELKEYGGHNQTVRWEGVLHPRWLAEASFGRAQNDTVEIPSVDQWSVVDLTVRPNIRSGGIGFFEQVSEGKNRQYQVKSTAMFDLGGTHEVRGGLLYEDIDYVNQIQRTGPTFVLPNGDRTVTGAQVSILADPQFGRIFRVTRANTSNVRDTSQDYTTWFAQDTYRIQRATVNGGVRWEQQELHGNLADFTLDDNYAWRIGGTYDLLGDGKTKLFAHGGRFYAKIPNDLAARALSADAGVTRADYFDANLTRPVPQGVPAAGVTNHFIIAGTSASDIDPEVKSSYLNEYLVGGEHELLPQLNVGVRYIHRNIARLVEDIGTAPLAAFFTGQADTVEFFLTNPSENTPVIPGFGAAHEKGIHDYDAIEVTADKRFSDNWQVLASYRYARLEGTFEGFFRNDNGQSDPAITSLFDFPTNDPSFAQILTPLGARGDIRFLGKAGEGPLPNDRRHQTKIFGSYVFDRWVPGLNVGAGLKLTSGRPLTALAANPVFTNAGEIPEGPRGSGFDTVFDGFRTRTKLLKEVDLHLAYGVPVGGGMKVSGILDIFNLFDFDTVTNYDNFTESTFGVLNPNFGQPVDSLSGLPAFQTPIQVRIGARLDF
ncbi:MAG: TonB-dependent receptor [Acidobacteria bacterium]|nr:TonB-dependent receptor [Acidobacteriota bacterium]